MAACPIRLFPSTNGWFRHQRETERGGLLRQCGIEVATGKRQLGLRQSRLQCAEIPNPSGAPGRFEKSPVKLDDFCQREIAHQARRRYSSSFFFSTRSAAVLKSSPVAASRSETAARQGPPGSVRGAPPGGGAGRPGPAKARWTASCAYSTVSGCLVQQQPGAARLRRLLSLSVRRMTEGLWRARQPSPVWFPAFSKSAIPREIADANGDRVMDRRAWLAASLGLFAAPLVGEAWSQARTFRIGLLGGSPPTGPDASPIWAGFFQGLREFGYVEGQNVVIEGRYCGTTPNGFPLSRPNWFGSRST